MMSEVPKPWHFHSLSGGKVVVIAAKLHDGGYWGPGRQPILHPCLGEFMLTENRHDHD